MTTTRPGSIHVSALRANQGRGCLSLIAARCTFTTPRTEPGKDYEQHGRAPKEN